MYSVAFLPSLFSVDIVIAIVDDLTDFLFVKVDYI